MPESTQDNSLYLASADPDGSSAAAFTHAPLLPESMNEPRDLQLIGLWLHGRSRHTQRGYAADAARFLAFVGKPLRSVSLIHVQAFDDSLAASNLKTASRRRILSAVKSLFAFGHRLGYLPFDTAKPLRLPSVRDNLSERVLHEADVLRMLALERHPRNALILLVLYATGVRVSELCNLRWRDCQRRDEGGQVAIFGKGDRTRVVLLPQGVWAKLMSIRGQSPDDASVFMSRRGGRLDESQVFRLVKRAAVRAGVSAAVSPHWLRHAHASHALDRGAPVHLVQATLGHSDLSTTGRYLHARPADGSARYLSL